MSGRTQRLPAVLADLVHERISSWRSGSPESQVFTLAVLLAGVSASFIVSLLAYPVMPLTAYFVWLLLGMLLLRFRPLVILAVYTLLVGLVAVLQAGPITGARISATVSMVLGVTLILYQSSRHRSGLPVPLGEAMLADLRDRLQFQGRIPMLPTGWQAQSAMIAAHNVEYAGDFLVADLSDDEQRLELILVDVCGKGVAAGTQALQFAGALGALIGALPPPALLAAANDFLLRQQTEEAFATAVHVLVELRTGHYAIRSAGHPPALRWHADRRTWEVDNARGTALGVVEHPELSASSGTLEIGDALMFYTDGVVESRSIDLETGIRWLQGASREAVAQGFTGAAQRVLDRVEAGDDDRAVLILTRSLDSGAPDDGTDPRLR